MLKDGLDDDGVDRPVRERYGVGIGDEDVHVTAEQVETDDLDLGAQGVEHVGAVPYRPSADHQHAAFPREELDEPGQRVSAILFGGLTIASGLRGCGCPLRMRRLLRFLRPADPHHLVAVEHAPFRVDENHPPPDRRESFLAWRTDRPSRCTRNRRGRPPPGLRRRAASRSRMLSTDASTTDPPSPTADPTVLTVPVPPRGPNR